MKSVLCIGSGSQDSDKQAKIIALKNKIEYKGLLSNYISDPIGCFHTSLYDLNLNNLIDQGKKFNKVIFLDQDVSEYHNEHDFYESQRICKLLEPHTQVQFVNQSHNNQLIDLLKENKSFCIMPFVAATFEKNISTCCWTTKDLTRKGNFNFYTNEEFKNLRKDVLENKMPSICSNCHDLEEQGIVSFRQTHTIEWSYKLGWNTLEKVKPNLVHYVMRPGNECNLMCRTCDPERSNLLDKEFFKIGIANKKHGLIQYNHYDVIDYDKVRYVSVLGGESTIDKNFIRFLKKCVENNTTQFDMHISTNAVVITDEFLELVDKFQNFEFSLSLDGFGKVNEYIRWPSKWEKVQANMKMIYKKFTNKVNFLITVSIYNILNLHTLLQYIQETFPNVKVILMYNVDNKYGEILPSWKFPNKKLVKDELQKIKSLHIYHEQELVHSKIDGIERMLDKVDFDKQELENFFYYNDLLDSNRKIKLQDYIPELEECRKLITKQT